jgi:hypothetical protein
MMSDGRRPGSTLQGRMKLRRMARMRGGTPREQRADAGEEEQEEADGDGDAVIEGRADGDLVALTTYSERTGKSVPQRTVKQAASRTRLLKRKLDSRLTRDSRWWSVTEVVALVDVR